MEPNNPNQPVKIPDIPMAEPVQPESVFKIKLRNLVTKIASQKKVATIFGILILAGAIGTGAYLAQQNQSLKSQAGTAVLTLSSSAQNLKIGDTFTVYATVDTKGLSVNAADVRIRYSTNDLEAVKIEPGSDFLPVILMPGVIDKDETESGRAWIITGALIDSSGTHPKSGVGVVAKVTFRAKANGTTTLTFGTSTRITAVGQSSDVTSDNKNTLNITISTSQPPETKTAEPTSKATPKPTVKPSPTPAPTADGPSDYAKKCTGANPDPSCKR